MKKVIEYLLSDKTKEEIVKQICGNLLYYQGIDTDGKIQKLSGLCYNYFVHECVQANQYISLSNKVIESVNELYRQLVVQLRELSFKSVEASAVERIVSEHRKKIISVLEENSDSITDNRIIIPCAEYSGAFQTRILRICACPLMEPILDIGCGKQQELITELKKQKYTDVFGIDQYQTDSTGIFCGNWFEFYFCENTWGTVIAHMSFSNHFRRSVILKETVTDLFQAKYDEILRSLRGGGAFIYTPAIKEVEAKLDAEKYHVRYFSNCTDKNLDTVYVIREL